MGAIILLYDEKKLIKGLSKKQVMDSPFAI